MKRILSWIVLYLLSIVVDVIIALTLSISISLLDLVNELNTFLKIVCYIIGGSAFMGFLFTPPIYGAALVINATEAIHPSKKGTRYIVFSSFNLILTVIYIIIAITEDTFPFQMIIMCIYYVVLLVIGCNLASEAKENQFTKIPNRSLLRDTKTTIQEESNHEEETYYLMEAKNGATVNVPATKLKDWLEEQNQQETDPLFKNQLTLNDAEPPDWISKQQEATEQIMSKLIQEKFH